MIRDGMYSLWALKHTEQPTQATRRLVARFLVEQGNVEHLEDHYHHLDDILPAGPIDKSHMRVLAHLLNTGFYRLEHDDDVDAAHHSDAIPEMEINSGMLQAPKYKISGGDYNGKTLEIIGEVLAVEKQKLSDADTRKFLAAVESGDVELELVEDKNALL